MPYSSRLSTQFLTSHGVFGGSNALWKTEGLKRYRFRHDVQAEDRTQCTPTPCTFPSVHC